MRILTSTMTNGEIVEVVLHPGGCSDDKNNEDSVVNTVERHANRCYGEEVC